MLTETLSHLTLKAPPKDEVAEELKHLWQEGLQSGGGREMDIEEIKREARLWVSLHANSPDRPRFPDLIELWAELATEDTEKADHTLDAISDRLELLATNQRMGLSRPDIADGMHLFRIQSHVVFYRVFPNNGVQLVRAIRWNPRMANIINVM